MPKKDSPKLRIHLDLLHPQSNPEKIPVKLVKWLLSTGRYILIFVEAIVLIAFIARFKLDTDLAEKKDAIEQQIPYIESLKAYEVLIRQTQLKLSTIDSIKNNQADYPLILKKIAGQTPLGVKINSLSLQKETGKILIQMDAESKSNSDLTGFVSGLKGDQFFSEISLSSISLEQGVISFTITGSSKLNNPGGISL